MTVVPKIVESFKAVDFDVDFFVSESLRDTSAKVVNDQLDLCENIVRSEIRDQVKACTNIIVAAASVSDDSLGVLLSAREHLVSAKNVLASIKHSETERYSNFEVTRTRLRKAIEISKLLRRLSRISIDMESLKAQFPSETSLTKQSISDIVNKGCEMFSQIESLRGSEKLDGLKKLELVKSDIEWIRSVASTFREKAIQQLRSVLIASSSLAGRDVLAVSKSVQVLFNLGCLREDTNNLVQSVVESHSKTHMAFLDKITVELKRSSMNIQNNGDRALNLFWEILDAGMASVAGLIAQVTLLEAVCELGTDPSSGASYRDCWEGSSPNELTDLTWAFVAKTLTQSILDVAEKVPKLKQAMRSAEYLKSGVEKVAEEARHSRNEVYELVEAGTSQRPQQRQEDTEMFRVSVVVDRLKQILR